MATRFRLLPRSLIGRVFALYTVVLVAFVLAGLGLFYRYQFGVGLEDAQLRADNLGNVILPTLVDSAVIGDYDTIRRTLERAVPYSPFSSASFIDLKGGVVSAPHEVPPAVAPPTWLLNAVAARLYDANQPITVGGRDYGVLRLSFSAERIAGGLWEQTRIALWLGLISVVGGLLLIRWPLVRWLGNLDRIQAFEQAMATGQATPAMLLGGGLPSEFRKTFEVLGRAAESLQKQRAQAAVTLGAITDGVFTLDAHGVLVFANPAACSMAGQPLAEMLDRPAVELLPQLFEGLGVHSVWSGRRVTLAGPHRPLVLDTSLSPILGPDGALAGQVLACRDVSEKHALDQRLRAELRDRESALVTLRTLLEGLMQQGSDGGVAPETDDLQAITAMISGLVSRLQERSEQLDAIFALSPDGFVSFDARRRANYVSPAFERLTGLTAGQVLGAYEQDIEAYVRSLCAPGVPWRSLETLRRELREQAPGAPVQRTRIALMRPVKRVLEIGLREGSTRGISQVLSMRDVTHETEVEQMKSEFLSTAAHELRTPMASIYGFTELMIQRPLRPEQQREVMDTIHRQTGLMITIVNELLDLARIEARRGADFELETLDLSELADEVIRDFKPPGDRQPPRVVPCDVPCQVRVDRHKVAQALGNVLSNAYKYSPSGGAVQVALVFGDSDAGREVGLQVRDEGIGMTPAQLARVSERFYRADASGSIPGTGLGMAIVKEIIELLGGRMALASEPGRGTTVTLWMPQIEATQGNLSSFAALED